MKIFRNRIIPKPRRDSFKSWVFMAFVYKYFMRLFVGSEIKPTAIWQCLMEVIKIKLVISLWLLGLGVEIFFLIYRSNLI